MGELFKQALRCRARDDEEFNPGFRIWLGDRLGYEFGPYFPRLWRGAITLKCLVCVLLGRHDRSEFDWAVRVGHVEVATWNVEDFGSMDGTFTEWTYLKVRWGWRPGSWRYCVGREST